MAEVWINLLANAIKFSSQDGVIQIICYATDQVYVEITDHGCGMDKDTMSRILSAFTREILPIPGKVPVWAFALSKRLLRNPAAKFTFVPPPVKGLPSGSIAPFPPLPFRLCLRR